MEDHFADKHTTTPMPEALAAAVKLRHHEKEATTQTTNYIIEIVENEKVIDIREYLEDKRDRDS